MELEELLNIFLQLPDSEQKKELISKAEGLAAKVEIFNEKYANREDVGARSACNALEREIDAFVQEGSTHLQQFGEELKTKIKKEEEYGIIISNSVNIEAWTENTDLLRSNSTLPKNCTQLILAPNKNEIYAITKNGTAYALPEKRKIAGTRSFWERFISRLLRRYIDIHLSADGDCTYAHIDSCHKKHQLFQILPEFKQIHKTSHRIYLPRAYVYNKEIYCAVGDEIFKNNKKIAHRSGIVYTIGMHAGKIYDAGDYGVCETSDVLGENPLITDPCQILCSHKGNLYAAAGYAEKNSGTWDVTAKKFMTEMRFTQMYSAGKWLLGVKQDRENTNAVYSVLARKVLIYYMQTYYSQILPAPVKTIKKILEIKT